MDKNWEQETYPNPTPPPTQATPTKPPVTKKPIQPPKSTDKPDTCDTDYDAISVIRREIYIFKGKVGITSLFVNITAQRTYNKRKIIRQLPHISTYELHFCNNSFFHYFSTFGG